MPDTLTEDSDLSYRAQLKCWKFVYVPSIECPSELPVDLYGFQVQQSRWSKGLTQVALKLLRPELGAVIGAERFLAEIRTTAKLQHSHILPLFDSGEAD